MKTIMVTGGKLASGSWNPVGISWNPVLEELRDLVSHSLTVKKRPFGKGFGGLPLDS